MASPHPPHQPSATLSHASRFFLPPASPPSSRQNNASSFNSFSVPPLQFAEQTIMTAPNPTKQAQSTAFGFGNQPFGSTGIPFNPSAHNFSAPSPLGFGFGGLRSGVTNPGNPFAGPGSANASGSTSASGFTFNLNPPRPVPARKPTFDPVSTASHPPPNSIPSSPFATLTSNPIPASTQTIRPPTLTSSFGGLASLSGLELESFTANAGGLGDQTGGNTGVTLNASGIVGQSTGKGVMKRQRSDDSMGSGGEEDVTGGVDTAPLIPSGENKRVHKRAMLAIEEPLPDNGTATDRGKDGNQIARFAEMPQLRPIIGPGMKIEGGNEDATGRIGFRGLTPTGHAKGKSGLVPITRPVDVTPALPHSLNSGSNGKKRARDDEQEYEDQRQHGTESQDEEAMRAVDGSDRDWKGKRGKMDPEFDDQTSEGGRGTGGSADADLGVLLASLPSQTHLKLLLTLVQQNPELRPQLVSLIPTPELSTCIQVLDEKSRAIKEKMPVGAVGNRMGNHGNGGGSSVVMSPSSSAGSGSCGIGFGSPNEGRKDTVGFGFGFGTGAAVPHSFAFGQAGSVTGGSFGMPSAGDSGGINAGQAGIVSDGYVLNRLMVPLSEFCSSATTYLPYFLPLVPDGNSSTASVSGLHPTTSFAYLVHLTSLITRNILPLLPSNQPCPQNVASLLGSLNTGWTRWVAWVTAIVNEQGGMFAASVVQTWYKGISDLAESGGMAGEPGNAVDGAEQRADKTATVRTAFGFGRTESYSSSSITCAQASKGFQAQMRTVHHSWVRQVGWLIGKSLPGEGGMEMEM